MAQTEQGAFEIKYHHIEAPTKSDENWGREKHQRKLIIPSESGLDDNCIFRTSEIIYLKNSLWFAWRKLDGENIRVHWDGERAVWNGKTNNFVCNANFKDYMALMFAEEFFEEKFGRDIKVTLFGEHMGPKVQGNELGLKSETFVLFDVLVNNTWLDHDQVVDVAKFFGLCTPADFGSTFVSPLTNLIDTVAGGGIKEWEGMVAVPLCGLRDRQGNRIVVKIKNRDYLR